MTSSIRSDGKTAHTPGPWRVFICDDGKEWSGWPLSIVSVNDPEKSIVRPGGQWPYEWDAAISRREAVANAYLIAAVPDLLEALRDIASPLAAMKRKAEAEGARLSDMAYQIANDPEHLKRIAREAIAKATGERP